jgi:hypothetical protein
LATAVGLTTVDPTTTLASAGTPTSTEVPKTVWTPTTHDVFEKFERRKIREKGHKKSKNRLFLSERFSSVR